MQEISVEKLKCKYCDTEFNRKKYANYSVRCPKCYRLLEHVSDYGFGPVTPFYISVGSELAGIVEDGGYRYVLDFQGRKTALKETYLNAVKEAEKLIIDNLNLSVKTVDSGIKTKSGSLWFFGVSFGRPYDNVHKVKSIHYDGELLIIAFERWDELFVYNPQGIESTEKELKIAGASKVKWSYVPAGSLAKRQTQTYIFKDNKVVKITDYGEQIIYDGAKYPAVVLA